MATTGKARSYNDIKPVQMVDENGTIYGNKTVDNKIRTVTTPYYYEVSAGNISGHTPVRIYGVTPSTVLNTHSDLSELGVDVIPIPSTATAMELVSTSVNDAAAGTGARTIHVYGLDSTYAEQEEIVTTNGTTAVALANSYLRINHAYVGTAGSGGFAAGTISIQASGGGTEYTRITAGHNVTRQALYTVPLGKEGYVIGWSAGSTNKETRVFLQTTTDPIDDDLHAGIFYERGEILNKNSSDHREMFLPQKIVARADIKLTSEAYDASGGRASGTISLFVEDV